MPYSFTVERDRNLVTFRGSGLLSNQEFLGCIYEILSHPEVGPGFSFLVDLTEVTFHAPGTHEMRARVEVDKRLMREAEARRVALVANLPHVFGMIRMYELFMGGEGPEVRTFGLVEDARRWLDGAIAAAVPARARSQD